MPAHPQPVLPDVRDVCRCDFPRIPRQAICSLRCVKMASLVESRLFDAQRQRFEPLGTVISHPLTEIDVLVERGKLIGQALKGFFHGV